MIKPEEAPLANGRAMGFVGVSDLVRARAFYEGVLGLSILSSDGFAVVAELGGARVRISQVPGVVAAGYTVLGFEVPNTQATVEKLAKAGVNFEIFSFLGDSQQADGVWTAPGGTRVAWFKDPDGNLLSISDMAA